MGDTNTLRGALIEGLLGDVDVLVRRVETLPIALEAANKALAATITTFEASSDKYRETIAASTNKARNDLVTHVHSETAKAIALGSAEERLAISEAAKYALRTETTAAVTKALQSSLTTSLDSAVAKLALQLRQPWSQRLLEYGLVALVASVFTVALLHLSRTYLA